MLRTPPFRKAPLLLLRHKAVLAAVGGAAVILGLVVALTPQFLSSAASSALQRDLAGRCDSSYSGSLRPHRSFGGEVPRFPGVSEESREEIIEAIGDDPNLAEPRATIQGQSVFITPDGDHDRGFMAVPLYRSGYEAEVEVLRGGDRPGIWFDEYAHEQYGVDVGDIVDYEVSVHFLDGSEQTVSGRLEVTAIVEELVGLRGEDYWCGVDDLIGLTPSGDRLPPVGLVGLEVFGDLSAGHGPDAGSGVFLRGDEYWELPVELDGLTLSRVEEVLGVFREVGEAVSFDPEAVQTGLGLVSDRIMAVDEALTTAVRPLALVVTVVAFGLMAGSGSYWVDRRGAELRLLFAMGVGPGAFGLKAILEMLLPVSLGVAFGAGISVMIADLVGPGGGVEQAARGSGLWLALPAILGSLFLVGVVATVRSRRLLAPPRRGRASMWWTIPAAAVLGVCAYLVRRSIGDQAVVFGENQLVGSVDPLVILYPLLAFAAVALVAAELLLWVVPRVGRASRSHAFYLATRRITSSPGPVVVLLAGALIPVATLVYSAGLTRSTDESVQTKGRVFIGSEIRAPVFARAPLPPDLDEVATYVSRAERVRFGDIDVDFMVVDPDTFERGAYWNEGFSEASLSDLLGQIDTSVEPLPAIVANGAPPVEIGVVELGRVSVPVQVVATTVSFPGARVDRPLVVVSRSAFDAHVAAQDLTDPERDGTTDFLWVADSDVEGVEGSLTSAGIGFAFTTTIDEALDLTKFQAIIWTFDFLELYAALAGIIVVGAILLYADTRQRARNLSYALAVRMGLNRREHLLAGLIEIGGVVVLGSLLGSVVATLAARTIFEALDALPATPPPPIWSGTWDLVTILILVAFGVGWLAAISAQRTADGADISELLRHGE